MALPNISLRELLESGAHFGHKTQRWNPRMAPFIFGVRNNIHIIDLSQSLPMLYRGLQAIRDVTAAGGKVLFVGTKRQASDPIVNAATRCGQYYVSQRWLGGMLTNWKTISNSIKQLKSLEEKLEGEGDKAGFTKKELLNLMRRKDKLDHSLGGLRDMTRTPDILFVIDTNKEKIAIQEAQKLGIPVVAIVDSNSDPRDITYPIPGNDDSLRAINLYCDLVARAVLDGIQAELTASGVDFGYNEEPGIVIEDMEAAIQNSNYEQDLE